MALSSALINLTFILFQDNFANVNCHNFTREPKGLLKLGNPHICAEVKLCLCFFMPALEIVYREIEVFSSCYVRINLLKTSPYK